MNTQELSNEIFSLKETIEGLMLEIQYLRKDLKENNQENEKLRFRLSELESALDRN